MGGARGFDRIETWLYVGCIKWIGIWIGVLDI